MSIRLLLGQLFAPAFANLEPTCAVAAVVPTLRAGGAPLS